MQNHSPYDDGKQDAPDDVRLIDDDIAGKKDATERYLSLIRESDEAFKALTGYFEGVDEPTVIVLFGDHQPSDSVVRPILKLQGKDTRNLSEEDVEKRYIVPYVIWANYDIGTEHGRDMSANLLGNEVLKKAGAGAYPYRVFLGEVAQSYPVLSAVRTVDAAGETPDKEQAESDPLIMKYRMLQYYELFDRGK